MPVLAVETRVRGIAGLVTRVRALPAAVATLERDEQVLLVDELLARIVGHGVDSGIHANRVARARLDAVTAEDAAQLVDDELHRIPLVAAALVAFRILTGLDEDALRRARRGATQASDAARAPVVAHGEPVDTAEPLRVRAFLLRVADRRDAVGPALGDRIGARAADHVAR